MAPPATTSDLGVCYGLDGKAAFCISDLTAVDYRTGEAAYTIDGTYFRGVDGRTDLYFDPATIDEWMLRDLLDGAPWKEHLAELRGQPRTKN